MALQNTVQLIMNRFRQMDLNIENKILLQTLEDETDGNTTLVRSVEESLRYIAGNILCSF